MSYHDLTLSLAQSRFGRDGVSHVDVHKFEIFSGDPAWEVVIVLDDHAVPFDPDEAILLKRELRAAFDAEGASNVIVSFRSRFDEAA